MEFGSLGLLWWMVLCLTGRLTGYLTAFATVVCSALSRATTVGLTEGPIR